MSWTELENGTLITATTLNNNFDYLDRKIDLTKTEITGNSNVTIASMDSQVLSLSAGINTLVPVGTIIWHIGDPTRAAYAYIPEGYLLCNGDQFNKADFAALNTILGGRFDLEGDDPLKFRTPNLCGTDPSGYSGYFTKATFSYALAGTTIEGYVGYEPEGSYTGSISGTTGDNDQNHTHRYAQGSFTETNTGGNLNNHKHPFSASYPKVNYTEPKYMLLLPCIKY